MTEVGNKDRLRSLAATVFFIFAVFGFAESIFTISDALSDDKARLEARAYASRPMVPSYFFTELRDDKSDNGRKFLDEAAESCDRRLAAQEAEDIGEDYKISCSQVYQLNLMSERVKDAYLLVGAVFEIELENKGSTTAKDIIVSSSSVEFFDVFSRGARINAEYDAQRRAYKIPDLNPGESLRMEIWQKGMPYNNKEFYETEAPAISFDGPAVQIVRHEYVPSDRWAIAEFFFDAGPIFGTILFIGVGFLVGIAFIVIFVVAVGVAKGKTLREIFATPSADSENNG
ncbi:MAG: hypothetical protein V2I43_28910 [Parvularcula sp.]|jgi:hypothetical protein|nr:hypothetical protein [Parvularcula sp.]